MTHRRPGADGYRQVEQVAPGGTLAAPKVAVGPLRVRELLAAAAGRPRPPRT